MGAELGVRSKWSAKVVYLWKPTAFDGVDVDVGGDAGGNPVVADVDVERAGEVDEPAPLAVDVDLLGGGLDVDDLVVRHGVLVAGVDVDLAGDQGVGEGVTVDEGEAAGRVVDVDDVGVVVALDDEVAVLDVTGDDADGELSRPSRGSRRCGVPAAALAAAAARVAALVAARVRRGSRLWRATGDRACGWDDDGIDEDRRMTGTFPRRLREHAQMN
jgi:hypothetical protein